MKRKRYSIYLPLTVLLLAVLAVAIFLLVTKPGEKQLSVMLVNNSSKGPVFVREKLNTTQDFDERTGASYLAYMLFSGKFSSGYFPASTHTDVYSVTVRDKTATVNLSKAYTRLSPIEMALSDCCLVNTLCTLDGIDSVVITVNSAPHPVHGANPLSPDVFDTSLDTFLPRRTTLRYYIPNFESGRLSARSETVETYSVRADYLYLYTFTELFTPPKDGAEIFPEGTSYISGYSDASSAHINISHHLLSFEGDLEQSILLLRAIVYTATEFADIDQVFIHITDSEGNSVSQFNGISLDKPFSRTTDYSILTTVSHEQ
ncbi:MAG: GerMN domain-containing protein [Clostridia bacterium]|nr:GerMN domain-containing protein [Clostridia bacterium]